MAITDLYTLFAYPTNHGSALPILVVMHGMKGHAESFTWNHLKRLANYGLFVIAPGMRGRNDAGGTEDCSGREIHDIYDVLGYVRGTAPYNTYASPTHAAILGYSGGGGNALAAACKFPDAWTHIISYFGMSDYGDDGTYGWYNQDESADYRDEMVAWIGDTPANVPEAYAARNTLRAIANYSGGYVYMYHDEADNTVASNQSQRVADALAAAGLSNYTLSISTAEDSIRYQHGYPEDHANLIVPESVFCPAVASGSPWTIAVSGAITVIGYIVTKRFSIWLGGLTEAAAGAGLDEVATVVYDTSTGEYTVTPVTGNMDVFIKQGEQTASQSITEATLLTVS